MQYGFFYLGLFVVMLLVACSEESALPDKRHVSPPAAPTGLSVTRPQSTQAPQADRGKQLRQQLVFDSLQKCVQEFDNNEWGVAMEECSFAANSDEAQAQYLLAEMTYSNSDIGARNRALELYKASAKNGYAEAILQMARFYENGRHVVQNTIVAEELYKEACENKLADACNTLSILYFRAFNYQGGIPFLKKAEQYGSILAKFNMGYVYENGSGVVKSQTKAFDYYYDAAMLGSNIAQFRMFWYNYKGKQTKKDYFKAYIWLLISAADRRDDYDRVDGWGREIPAKARFQLERLLSREELVLAAAEAERLKATIVENSDQHIQRHRYSRPNIELASQL